MIAMKATIAQHAIAHLQNVHVKSLKTTQVKWSNTKLLTLKDINKYKKTSCAML